MIYWIHKLVLHVRVREEYKDRQRPKPIYSLENFTE